MLSIIGRLKAWRTLRRPVVTLGAVGALLVGLGYGAYLWSYWQTHASTDDAFVDSNIAPISARVSGAVLELRVADNQQVTKGDVLMHLDPRDYQVKLEQARAALLMAQGSGRGAALGVGLTDESTDSQVRQAQAALDGATLGIAVATSVHDERRSQLRMKQAAVAAARAAVDVAHVELERAGLDRGRGEELLRKELVARQDFDHTDATFKTAGARLEASRRKVDEAEAEVLRTEAEVTSQTATVAAVRRRVEENRASLSLAVSRRGEVGIRRTEVDTATGRVAEALANLQEAELRLEYTVVHAPISGRITKRNVEIGQVVQVGQPLLAIVALDDVWIVANYKETELTEVRSGQRVTIRVDTYPGVTFKGRVDSIQAGTGSRFALLPSENASGNFVKIVQRIPVKIVLDRAQPARRSLLPGMSVIAEIALR